MDLGELELALLSLLRERGEMSPSQLRAALQEDRDIAYTSVTTTLYRLRTKGLVGSRKAPGGRMLYAARPLSQSSRKTLSELVGRLVDAFGESTVSHAMGGAYEAKGKRRRARRP